MKPRYLRRSVFSDLSEKMVFVGGPRQVGKTTFALSMLPGNQDETAPAYLNWDVLEDRESIIAARLPPNETLVIFDEIHKYAGWRNLVKGLYDKNKSSVSFLVTGSARLDYYRKGGDSLQGRYHYHRLHPFSVMELTSRPDAATGEQLLTFGGFPEPFLKASNRFHRRWFRENSHRVIHEDLASLENVREISKSGIRTSGKSTSWSSVTAFRSLRSNAGPAIAEHRLSAVTFARGPTFLGSIRSTWVTRASATPTPTRWSCPSRSSAATWDCRSAQVSDYTSRSPGFSSQSKRPQSLPIRR